GGGKGEETAGRRPEGGGVRDEAVAEGFEVGVVVVPPARGAEVATSGDVERPDAAGGAGDGGDELRAGDAEQAMGPQPVDLPERLAGVGVEGEKGVGVGRGHEYPTAGRHRRAGSAVAVVL